MTQKTIFITSFFGLIARNILSTDFLKILRLRQNLRVVIFAPEKKAGLYRDIFGSDNVIVEGVEPKNKSRLEIFLSSIFLNGSDTSARRIHRTVELRKDGKYLSFFYHLFLAKTLGKSGVIRNLLRRFDYLLYRQGVFEKYFTKYNPDLVFSTDLFEPSDIDMIRDAKKRNTKTIGMIRSWDNITTKGINRVIPDILAVNSNLIMEEAVEYCDIDRNKIRVVGIPHYDDYVRNQGRISKEELFCGLSFDVNKKTVFFAPPSSIYSDDDPIAEAVVDSMSGLDVQMILRLYLVGGVNLGSIKVIPGKIAIDNPGVSSNFSEADLVGKDAHLADLLYYSDVVVAFASTLAIDAIVFDKPVVFIGFDAKPKPYWKSLRRFYDYDHQRSLLATGGVKLARNKEELASFVQGYLNNPSLDKDGREKIVEQRCWKLDGKSGERLAQVIINELSK